MKILNCILFNLLLLSTTYAQDDYHRWLSNQLQNDYGLSGGTFVFGDREDDKQNAYNHFNGNITPEQRMTVSEKNISNQPFTKAFELNTPIRLPDNKNTQVGSTIKNKENIENGDTLLLVFWAKGVDNFYGFNGMAKVAVRGEGEIEMYKRITYFNDEWTQYLMPMKANGNFDPGELSFFFSFGYRAQKVQFGGVALINYGPSVSLSSIPGKLGPNAYQGISPNASWRAPAQNRIEEFRKANLKVNVVDENDNPINGATVEVDMNQHHFGFGTAVDIDYLLPENDDPNSIRYREKLFNVDGRGHGFNEGVFENSLEWKKWETDNFNGTTKRKKIEMLQYLKDNGMKVRGHSLLWPSYKKMPADMEENNDNPSFLKTEIRNHINTILQYNGIKNELSDWDAINEITNKRAIEKALIGEEGREGRAFYDEILRLAKDNAPNTPMYLNDYMTISYGTIGEKYDSCKNFLKEIYDARAPFDGIGFQAHLRGAPIGIPTVYSVLEDFNQTFNREKDFKITEFDMRDIDSTSIEYQYMKDFLTICFSHEKVKSFIMWGFWDGAHWTSDGPLFELSDWRLKPGGNAFKELVFDEWWTDEQGNTNNAGRATFRPFKGKHTVKATYNGVSEDYEVDLTEDGEITIQLPVSVSEPGLLGDADCDGDVDAVDALAILQYTVGVREGRTSCPLENQSTQINTELGDVNDRDGAGAVDALFILQCVVGIENVLCPN